MAEEDQTRLQHGLEEEAANLPKIMNKKYQHDLAYTTGVLPYPHETRILLQSRPQKTISNEVLFNYKRVLLGVFWREILLLKFW